MEPANVRLYRIVPVERSEYLEPGRYVVWDESEDRPVSGYRTHERQSIRSLVSAVLSHLGPKHHVA